MSSLSILFSEWHTAIVKEASATGKPRLLLSAGVYFSSNFFLSETPRTYPGDAIKHYVDFVNPMCYDYHGAWDTSVTGAQALLYDKSSNLSTSYGISSWIRNGVPAKKLVMGLPMYGRTWQLKDPNEHGIGAPAVGIGPGNDGLMIYSDIVDLIWQTMPVWCMMRRQYRHIHMRGRIGLGTMDPHRLPTRLSLPRLRVLVGISSGLLDLTRTGHSQEQSFTNSIYVVYEFVAASLAWDGKI
ncbi:hypothetical protein F0562_030300 [Nyssa sinensis]|uniref:GH18 domain-containing protein n=1 Tax=Nyssa sinensis TaxID=561372 RepID=A0A5J5B0L3_9ASTE|nr:hypothetical protein F0562_030300 [Nyssa sinensis]